MELACAELSNSLLIYLRKQNQNSLAIAGERRGLQLHWTQHYATEFKNSFSPDVHLIGNGSNALLDFLCSLVSKEIPRKIDCKRAGQKALLQLLTDGNTAGKPLLLSATSFELFYSCPSPQQCCSCRTHRNLCVSSTKHNCIWQHCSESRALKAICSTSAFKKCWSQGAVLKGWHPLSTPEKIAPRCSAVTLPRSASAFCFFLKLEEDDMNKNSSFHGLICQFFNSKRTSTAYSISCNEIGASIRCKCSLRPVSINTSQQPSSQRFRSRCGLAAQDVFSIAPRNPESISESQNLRMQGWRRS